MGISWESCGVLDVLWDSCVKRGEGGVFCGNHVGIVWCANRVGIMCAERREKEKGCE